MKIKEIDSQNDRELQKPPRWTNGFLPFLKINFQNLHAKLISIVGHGPFLWISSLSN